MLGPDGRPTVDAARVPRLGLGRLGMMRYRRSPAAPGLMGAPNGRPPEVGGGPMLAAGPAVDALRARLGRPQLGTEVRPAEMQPPLGAAMPADTAATASGGMEPPSPMGQAGFAPPDGAPGDPLEDLKRKRGGTDMPPPAMPAMY